MQGRLLRKILVGLCFALSFLLLTGGASEAGTRLQADATQAAEATEDCQSCHGEIHDEWTESMHGEAATGLVFQRAWKKQESPPECLTCHTTGFDLDNGTWEEDGIACSVCHSPVAGNHPEAIMPTNASPDACGSCHEDTYSDWEHSIHGEEELACVKCHNPHTTDLKASGTQELCQTCHNEESHFYNDTAHAEEGLLCTDCHLRVSDAPMLGEGHSQRQHTFEVDLQSCTQCHGDDMHYPVQNALSAEAAERTAGEEEIVQAGLALPSSERATRIGDAEPESRNPLTYVLAIAAGLGLGIIVTPGLDALYRRVRGQ